MSNKEFKGFTLAEVLITLGIIGVVAAMTMPVLIQNHRKHVVETKLAKFYSVMNQAVKLSEIKNGPVEYWEPIPYGYKTDSEGTKDTSISYVEQWFNEYLRPYLNLADVKIDNVFGNVLAYFSDGSMAVICGASVQYYINAKDFVEFDKLYDEATDTYKNNAKISGIRYFTFIFYTNKPSDTRPATMKCDGKTGLLTFGCNISSVNLLESSATVGCNKNASNERAYCSRIIELNGWKIPKNYPLKL